MRAADEIGAFGAVHQLHRGVVADQHALRNVGDGWPFCFGQAHNLEQLVMLRGHARGLRGVLAVGEEHAQTEAEIGEIAERARGGQGLGFWFKVALFHSLILS